MTEKEGSLHASKENHSAEEKSSKSSASNKAQDSADPKNGQADASANPQDTNASAKTGEAPRDPEAEITEWKKRFAYLSAEVENMKKRQVKERSETIRFANENLLSSIFPVLDNLFLATKAVHNVENTESAQKLLKEPLFKSLVEGVDMTIKHFQQTLQSVGVEAIDALDKKFDPLVHEAMGQSENPEKENDVITQVFQCGWKLHGRVIRPAKVIVNKIEKKDETGE